MSEHVSWLLRTMTETSLVIDALDKATRGLDATHQHHIKDLAAWAQQHPVAATEILAALADGLLLHFAVSGMAPRAKLLEEMKELIDDLQWRMTSPDELLGAEKGGT